MQVEIFKITVPAIITCVLLRAQDTVNLIFLGHLKDKDLIAGQGLGYSYLNVMGNIMVMGLLMAMDTLISQAKGVANIEMCGVYLNRARFVVTLIYIPMFIISHWVEELLILSG